MKLSYISLLVILLIELIFISGCASKQTQPTEASDCPSPYDGTYSGLVSGSGEVTCGQPGEEKTKSPYIITYQLEVTFECVKPTTFLDENNKDHDGWDLRATHVKVSDPYFECTNGCTPVTPESISWAPFMLKPGESGGQLVINFQNGKQLRTGPLITDPDAKRISADQDPSKHEDLIFWSMPGWDWNGKIEPIETYWRPHCYAEQEGFTMTLDKIS